MPHNLMRDVDVSMISLVKRGANRKRFFLRKSAAGSGAPMAAFGRLIKAADWSAVYCVVAEPGWLEDPGLISDTPDLGDIWASEEEIRKAAHRFAKNGGLINLQHDGADLAGQTVENYIAPVDFEVEGELIKAGSWVVAIEPDPELRDSIEKGDLDAVSIEGTALRELVKAAAGNPAGRAGSLPGVKEDGKVRKALAAIGKALGVDPAEFDVVKTMPTFNERMAEREVDDQLPVALDELQSCVWRAFNPWTDEEDDEDPVEVITASVDQFRDWLVDLLQKTTVAKAGEAGPEVDVDELQADIAKAIGLDEIPPQWSSDHRGQTATLGGAMLSKEDRAEIQELVKSAIAEASAGEEGSPAPTGPSAEEIAKAAAEAVIAAQAPPAPPSAEDLSKALEDVQASIAEKLDPIAKSIEALGEGSSAQDRGPSEPAQPVAKSADAPRGYLR